MNKIRYDSFENGTFCIEIEHARRFGIESALMITQFKQKTDSVFCRAFVDGDGYSRKMEDLLPISDKDAMTIYLSKFIQKYLGDEGAKMMSIDDLIKIHEEKGLSRWQPDEKEEVDIYDVADRFRRALEKLRPLCETVFVNGAGEDMSSEVAEMRDIIVSALRYESSKCESRDVRDDHRE